jgi:hypothetical protein
MHLPSARNALPVRVHCWTPVPLQVHNWIAVALALLAPATSTHVPPYPWIAPPPVGGPVVGPKVGPPPLKLPGS